MMTEPKLSFDIARCRGYMSSHRAGFAGFATITIGQDHCLRCLRRTVPGREEYQVHMEPPKFENGKCEYRIEQLYVPE